MEDVQRLSLFPLKLRCGVFASHVVTVALTPWCWLLLSLQSLLVGDNIIEEPGGKKAEFAILLWTPNGLNCGANLCLSCT